MSRKNVAAVSFRIIDRIDNFPKDEQVAALAVLFLYATRTLKLSPSHLFDIASKISNIDNLFKDEQDRSFDGIKAYFEGEIK